MKNNNQLYKFFFLLLPFLYILLVWFLFAYPYFLKARIPYSSTYQVNFFPPWSAYPEFWGPVKNNAMPDVTTQIYPWRYLTIETWKKGEIPLWNPYSFSGTPHLANYQSAVLSPFNIIFLFFPFIDAWSILVLVQPLIAGISTYLFIRSLSVSKPASIVSSVSFMFCGFITVWMGYGTLAYAIGILPFSLYCIEKYYQRKLFRYLLLFSLSIPLSFFNGHFQTSIYFSIFICAYLMYKYIEQRNIFYFSVTSIYFIFGVLLSLPQILPSIEFYQQSLRSSLFEKAGSIPWKYLPTLIVPDFYGNPVTRNDWYGYYAEWSSYIGVGGIGLALYTLVSKKNKKILFFIFMSIVSALLAYDTFLVDLLIRLHIPVLSTSAPNRIIVLFSFSIAILAGFGLDYLLADIKNKYKKKVFIWFSLLVLILGFLWILTYIPGAIPVAKSTIAKSNLIFPTIILGGIGLLTFALLFVDKKIGTLITCLLLVLISVDMLRFSKKWQAFDPKSLAFPETTVTRFFPKIAGFYRSFGNYGAEASVYYRLPSVEGYDALYIQRYGQLIASLPDGTLRNSGRSVVIFPKDTLYTPRALELLGIKYIVHKVSDGRFGWAFPFWKYPKGMFTQIFNDTKYEIYENTSQIPRVFTTNEYSIIENPQKIISALLDSEFDPTKEVILEEAINIPKEKQQITIPRIDSYTPNHIYITADVATKSLLFLSDNYYPGWKAYVNGKETKIYRANFTFRAIVIDKGSHSVEFSYEPGTFKVGVYSAIVSMLCIILSYFFLPKLKLWLKYLKI